MVMNILPLTTWSYIFSSSVRFPFIISNKYTNYFAHVHAKYTRPYFQRAGIEARVGWKIQLHSTRL